MNKEKIRASILKQEILSFIYLYTPIVKFQFAEKEKTRSFQNGFF